MAELNEKNIIITILNTTEDNFLNNPGLDTFVDLVEWVGLHFAGIWSVVVVAYNALNDVFLTARFDTVGEILSLEFFYAFFTYLTPGNNLLVGQHHIMKKNV